MPRYNTIKEYLISLGFKVDENQYKEAVGVVEKFGNTVAKVAVNPLTGMAGLTSAFYGIMKAAASADMKTEKFARRMWMSEANARGLTDALNAMGESIESINDVAISPELRSSFFALRADAAKYEDANVDASMRKIRDFQFEFQRFKLLMTNATRYIAYYLEQYLSKPMERFKSVLKDLNDNGRELLEKWGKRIGKFARVIVNVGESAIRAAKSIIDVFGNLPGKVKVIAGALAAVGAIIAAPWLAVSAIITGVLLLIEDYYRWKDGKESVFGDLYDKLADLKPLLDDIKNKLEGLWDSLKPYLSSENAKKLIPLITALWGFHKVATAISLIKDFSGLSAMFGLMSKIGKLAVAGGAFSAAVGLFAMIAGAGIYEQYKEWKEDPMGYSFKRAQEAAEDEGVSVAGTSIGKPVQSQPQASVPTIGAPVMANAPQNLSTSNTTNNTSNTNNSKKITNNVNMAPVMHNTFNVTGASNPQSTASTISATMNNVLGGMSNALLDVVLENET